LFEKIFDEIQVNNPEIRCIGVWGRDGLVLEKKVFVENPTDLELLGAQIADITAKFDSIKMTSQRYNLKIDIEDSFLMVFSLTADYFMVVLTDRTTIPGKLAFYVDALKNKLISLL
jgi:predicted regulator of Ras-like GTPase activity (Roadblock/LC7/MglB family)